jgi:hypothetical protein
MSNPCEPTRPKGKAGTRKPGGSSRLSAAERRRRKAEADRRYYERYRSGCGVTAYLYSPELKKAVTEKLRPLGVTMSQAIYTLLEMLAEGRIVLTALPRKPE